MDDDQSQRPAGLAAADEALMSGHFEEAAAAYDALLERLGAVQPSEVFESIIYRAALLVRAALSQYLVGAEQEADEMLGYLDRQLSVAVRNERDAAREAELAEAQDNARYYRLRLAEASQGGELEFPVTLCQHNRQVPLLPCGFTTDHD